MDNILSDLLLILPAELIFWLTLMIAVYKWDRDKFLQSPSFERTAENSKGYANKCQTAKRIIRNISLCYFLLISASCCFFAFVYLTRNDSLLIPTAEICYAGYILTVLYAIVEIILANTRMEQWLNTPR